MYFVRLTSLFIFLLPLPTKSEQQKDPKTLLLSTFTHCTIRAIRSQSRKAGIASQPYYLIYGETNPFVIQTLHKPDPRRKGEYFLHYDQTLLDTRFNVTHQLITKFMSCLVYFYFQDGIIENLNRKSSHKALVSSFYPTVLIKQENPVAIVMITAHKISVKTRR